MSKFTSEEQILKHFGGYTQNSLLQVLNVHDEATNTDGEIELTDHSPFIDHEQLVETLRANKNKFNILSVNIASINAKIDQLQILVNSLNEQNCNFDAICIQESWLSNDSDTSLLNIDGFNLISQGKIASERGGLLIYLDEKYEYRELSLYTRSDVWEGQFIEIFGDHIHKKIIIGNIYRPPRNVLEKA